MVWGLAVLVNTDWRRLPRVYEPGEETGVRPTESVQPVVNALRVKLGHSFRMCLASGHNQVVFDVGEQPIDKNCEHGRR